MAPGGAGGGNPAGVTHRAGAPWPWAARLPFYYGWLIVGIAFVTMAIGVSARTSFSLLLPPLLDEFGWERGLTAGAFSFGFLLSAAIGPLIGWLMDRHGPRPIIGTGIAMMGAGLLLAPLIREPWQLYLMLGVLVGVGANLMSFTAHSLFLPNWFHRRRGLAISIAFSGVGAGAILILPWQQAIIDEAGWRAACWSMGLLVLCIAGPLALLVRRRPEDIGLLPDGAAQPIAGEAPRAASNIVDAAWVATDWTLVRAVRTGRFWWIVVGYFCALFAWYAVQVHQTRYLVEIGFSASLAAWMLGLVSVIAIPGQIGFGALSDRVGREWVWTVGCAGFAICYAMLIAMEHAPSLTLLYAMVIAQGFMGYAMTAVMGPIVVEIFEGRHYGAIFGTINVPLMAGGAAGPWAMGAIHDATGSYRLGLFLALGLCVVAAAAIWMAAPGKVRRVPGRG